MGSREASIHEAHQGRQTAAVQDQDPAQNWRTRPRPALDVVVRKRPECDVGDLQRLKAPIRAFFRRFREARIVAGHLTIEKPPPAPGSIR
jgi:hypothetical protein